MTTLGVAGFNLIGHLSSRSGLGSAARMTMSLIDSRGWGLALTDLESGIQASVPVPVRNKPVVPLGAGPYPVTLLHMNPRQIMKDLLVWQPATVNTLGRSFLTCAPYWELEAFPDYWIELLRGTDCVLAPTRFIASALERAMDGVAFAPEIVHFMQAVPLVEAAPNRERWFGDRAGTTVFVSSFDYSSDTARKNPWAVIDAFLRAFEGRNDATLVFKTAHALEPGAIITRDALRARIKNDARVLVIDECLNDEDMRSLLASADAYVSLHRSEGLGLGMMESMSLGVPVIGTGWSGNMDFMTVDNSMLVPYSLVPVEADYHVEYKAVGAKSRWAEPDLDSAARAMAMMVDNPAARRALGLRARESMILRWHDYLRAPALEQTLELATAPGALGEQHRRRVARLYRDVLRRVPAERGKRSAVDLLRALRIKPSAPAQERAAGPLRELNPYRVSPIVPT